MRFSTIVGIIIGTLILIVSFLWEGGSLGALFLWPALLIVIGGTLAATGAGVGFKKIFSIPQILKESRDSDKYTEKDIKLQIYKISEIASKQGTLTIEKYLSKQSGNQMHPYLKRLSYAVIDGSQEEDLERLADFENERYEDQKVEQIQLFRKMGGYSPTMGIIGTVMGLIATMANAGGSPDELIRNIAVAFIATLWGIFLANIVFFPIADRLDTMLNNEMSNRSIIEQGMLAIARGDGPIKVRTLMGGRDIITQKAKA